MSTLFCDVCRLYEDKIEGMRNYSPVWVNRSANQKTSNIIDHAKSDQHAASLSYQRKAIAKATNQPVESYAPIARCLLVMDATQKVRMMHKFEICYVIAREGLAFLKYPALHALAERQGVELGSSYKRNDCASLFVHYIAEAQRNAFLQSISAKIKFFSFLMDGSTDCGNREQELIFIVYCNRDANTQEVKSSTRYLGIISPDSCRATGLIDCLKTVLLERLEVLLWIIFYREISLF